MAKFAYNMQSILNIKYKMENQEKIAYANAQAQLRMEEEKLRKIRSRRDFYEEKMRGSMEKAIDVRTLYECNQGIELMKEAIKEQKKEVAKAQKNSDKAHERLNAVVKERKTHEKLRENALEEFMAELNAQESKEIDEVVSYNYASAT